MMFKSGSRLVALAVTVWCVKVEGQSGAWLKTKVDTGSRAAASASRRMTADRWHMLLIFPAQPAGAEREQLESRGIRVLQFIPERGLMASVPETVPLEDIAIEWIGRLRPEQKLSPLLTDRGAFDSEVTETVVAEFHSDVPASDIVAILREESLAFVENPDLLATQRIVVGPGRQLARLAEWDEVSYVFPISTELSLSTPVEACPGAVTENGPIGQIVAKVGEGWDGPGKGTAECNLGVFVMKTLQSHVTNLRWKKLPSFGLVLD